MDVARSAPHGRYLHACFTGNKECSVGLIINRIRPTTITFFMSLSSKYTWGSYFLISSKILTPINPASDPFEAQAVCDEHRSVPLELVSFLKEGLASSKMNWRCLIHVQGLNRALHLTSFDQTYDLWCIPSHQTKRFPEAYAVTDAYTED